jgi:hypothetical protein
VHSIHKGSFSKLSVLVHSRESESENDCGWRPEAFPAAAEGQASVTVRVAELAMLLDDVDWQNARRSKRYHRPATG